MVRIGILAIGMGLLTVSLLLAAPALIAAPAPATLPAMPDSTPPGKPHFDSRGAQVGEQIPDLTVYSLDGQPHRLDEAWQNSGSPTLLITSSYTCPKSRSEYPRAALLVQRLGPNFRLVVIYVIEAHPNIDPSPYLGKEDLTPENVRDHVVCRQPRTLADRLALATKFKDRLGVSGQVFVDAMDNAAWKSLGGGPNMGMLVDSHGIVLARQGWFDQPSMEAAAKVFAAIPSDDRREPQSNGFDDFDGTRATVDGDLAKVQAQLAESPGLIHKIFPYMARGDSGDRTLLQYAVEESHLDIAKLLIERGADVNVQTLHAPSPLHMAAKAGSLPITQLLIAHGADVNAVAADHGPTPREQALLYGHRDVADALQRAGAKSNFFTAVAEGDTAAVQAALSDDPSISMRPDGWSRPPLVYAVAGNQPAMVKLLQASGACDLPGETAGWKNEESAIRWAVRAKNLAMVHLLCDTGSDPNLVFDAVCTGSLNVVNELLAHKADADRPSLNGMRPIYFAAGDGRLDIVQALVIAGADVNAMPGPDDAPCAPPFGPGSDIALHWAARDGSAKVVAFLLQHGAKISTLDQVQNTPLHAAADGPSTPDRVAAISELIAAHANVNALNRDAHTPLDLALLAMKASDKPDRAVVDFLRAHGAKEDAVAVP